MSNLCLATSEVCQAGHLLQLQCLHQHPKRILCCEDAYTDRYDQRVLMLQACQRQCVCRAAAASRLLLCCCCELHEELHSPGTSHSPYCADVEGLPVDSHKQLFCL
jgi:hypothetical protein